MRNDVLSVILGGVLLSGMLVSVYAPPPLERLPSTIPVLKDQSGRELFQLGVGEVTFIEATVSSQMGNQQFAYIVQIKDDKEFTVSLSWLTGELLRYQELKVRQSWIPEAEGNYFIETFVWRSVDNPDPLSPPYELDVRVLLENQPLRFDFIISTYPTSLKIKKGESSELTVIVEPASGEIDDVRLTVQEIPRGISVKLEEDFVDNIHRQTLARITAASSTVVGTHSFDIVGESHGIYHEFTVNVTVVKEDIR